MGRKTKKYEELTIVDDFMFGKVMRSPKRCKKLLEIILGVKIRRIDFLDDQDTMAPDYEAKGIRLDIYVEDDANSVYTVEMQTTDTRELPKRGRYYRSVIDINLIERGAEYADLKKSYVIFICTFDLFGRGRHVYHFENLCREDPDIRLEDGTEIVFLNTKGIMDDADEELQNLLEYFDSQVPRDEYTKELDDAVEDAKLHKEWRREYMKMEVLEYINRSQGRSEGEVIKLIRQVCRKIAKQKTPEEIAEDLDEDFEEIRRIYDAAVKYASDYDAEDIYEELSAEDMDI